MVPIVAGFQRKEIAKWAALPCIVFWLAIMVFIWLFLLGWARIVFGRFSPTEIAMTVVIGVAAIVGMAASARWRTSVRWPTAAATFLLFAELSPRTFCTFPRDSSPRRRTPPSSSRVERRGGTADDHFHADRGPPAAAL